MMIVQNVMIIIQISKCFDYSVQLLWPVKKYIPNELFVFPTVI